MNDVFQLISTDLIQVEITIRLGSVKMSVADISRLKPDDVITLDHDMTDGLEICVGDKVIARGELTSSNDAENRLCVRILGPAQEV